jgi:precorrin-6B methylase 2
MRLAILLSLVLTIPAAHVLVAQGPEKGSLAQFYATPMTIVDKMLQVGKLKEGEKMFDLGSGDARIVIMAAQKYKANAVGVELSESLVRQSRDRIRQLGLKNATIIEGDLLKQDYSSADLITVYLLPVGNNLVTPILEKQLKKGARVVAHDFEFDAWKPAQVVEEKDDEGRNHTIRLYQR